LIAAGRSQSAQADRFRQIARRMHGDHLLDGDRQQVGQSVQVVQSGGYRYAEVRDFVVAEARERRTVPAGDPSVETKPVRIVGDQGLDLFLHELWERTEHLIAFSTAPAGSPG
jgi:hypothetical protein